MFKKKKMVTIFPTRKIESLHMKATDRHLPPCIPFVLFEFFYFVFISQIKINI